jgi:hypothetical protein
MDYSASRVCMPHRRVHTPENVPAHDASTRRETNDTHSIVAVAGSAHAHGAETSTSSEHDDDDSRGGKVSK